MGNDINTPGHSTDNNEFRLCLSQFKDETLRMFQSVAAACTRTDKGKAGLFSQTFDSFPVQNAGWTLYFLSIAKDMPQTPDNTAESPDFPEAYLPKFFLNPAASVSTDSPTLIRDSRPATAFLMSQE